MEIELYAPPPPRRATPWQLWAIGVFLAGMTAAALLDGDASRGARLTWFAFVGAFIAFLGIRRLLRDEPPEVAYRFDRVGVHVVWSGRTIPWAEIYTVRPHPDTIDLLDHGGETLAWLDLKAVTVDRPAVIDAIKQASSASGYALAFEH